MSFLDDVGRGIDRVVGAFNPKAGVARTLARNAHTTLNRMQAAANPAYDGAGDSRRWANRKPSAGSADADLDEDTLDELRRRSRDRKRNDSLSHATIEAIVDNVVGFGFRPKLSLDRDRLGLSKTQAEDLEGEAGDIWDEWSPHADSCERLSATDIQAHVFGNMLVNGDHFAMPLMVQDGRSRFELRLEMVEADRVDTPTGSAKLPAHDRIRNGVELGEKRGEPVAYWITQEHPGEIQHPRGFSRVRGARTFSRTPAYSTTGRPNVLHLFHQERSGQSRGRPYLSIVLDALKDRDDYKEAELVAAQVAACFAVFITKPDPFTAALANATSDTEGKEERHQELNPGAMYYTAPGEKVDFGNPTRPNSVFDMFLRAVSREITGALGVPFEIAMRDFSGTTYSQARAAMVEARRMFVKRQRWLIDHFLQRVWAMLLEEAWLKNIWAPTADFGERQHLWTATEWQLPGWGHVDPDKEGKAQSLALADGTTTRQAIITARDGGDFRKVARQRAEEDEFLLSLGLEPGGGGSSSGDDEPPNTDDDDPDAVDDETKNDVDTQADAVDEEAEEQVPA